MKGYVFTVISKNLNFGEELKTHLAEIGECYYFDDVPNEDIRSSQIIFCDEDLIPSLPSVPSLIVALHFFENEISFPNKRTLYINRNADYQKISELICEKVKTVDFSQPSVFPSIAQKKESNESHPVPQQTPESHRVQKEYFEESPKEPPKPEKKKSTPRMGRRINKRMLFFGGLILFWIVLMPLASFASSATVSYLAAMSAKSFNLKTAKNLAMIARPLSSFTMKSADTLSFIPILGTGYKDISNLSSLENEGLGIMIEGLNVYEKIKAESFNFLDSDSVGHLDKMDRDIQSFIAKSKTSKIIASLLPNNVNRYSLLFSAFVSMIEKPGVFMGETTPSNYLVLFQNNMELRPTGGFIGSFSVLSIDKGRVVTPKIYDVYDADGQLTGYVAPPDPILKYLGEASWKMRDSNWDPDFKSSAERAVWFLDKTINKKAAVVVGIDLEVLKSILEVTGPVSVIDYNDTIDSNNFYQKIQSEVHEDFFPGTKKKSNYLTAVATSVQAKVLENKGIWGDVLISLLKNIDSHDIQLYSVDATVQSTLREAGLTNEIPSNGIGFVEANLGVNKANQYITRNGGVRYNKKTGRLEMTLKVKNLATTSSDDTRYRLYLRAFAPDSFSISNVSSVGSGIERSLIPQTLSINGRKEAGIFVQVNAREEVTVTYVWDREKEFGFNNLIYWKQPGVAPYRLDISLTEVGDRQYNTQVGKNLIIEF